MSGEFYRESIRRHGAGATLAHVAYRAGNRVAPVALWDAVVLTLDTVDPRFLVAPRGVEARMLEAASARRFVYETATSLTDETVDEAAGNGDRCHALFRGESLVSYGWFARRPVRLLESSPRLLLHFSPRYAYAYDGFTLPSHRGRGLHAVGMGTALGFYAKQGLHGLVGLVDCCNFASRKSCARVGCVRVGRILVLRLGERYVCRTTAGCGRYGMQVELTPASVRFGR